SILLAYWVRVELIIPWMPLKPGVPPLLSRYVLLALANAGVGVAVFSTSGLYRERRGMARFASATRIATMVLVSHILLLALVGLYRKYTFSRIVMAFTFGFELVFAVASNAILKRVQEAMIQRGIGFFRTLLIASEQSCRDLLPRLESTHGSLHQVVGVVLCDQGALPECVLGVPVTGRLEDASSWCDAEKVDRVILALPAAHHTQTLDAISVCEQKGIDYRIIPDLFEMLTLRVSVGDLNGLPTITLGETPLEGWGRFAKRTMDIVLSVLFLLLVSPLMLVSAALIKLTSPGPVFYTQERVGSDGRRFTIYKLRSMRSDAEGSGIGWSVKGDSRITAVGRVLRRLDIDEFPQFYNVLRGDMSLVGPRPERPYFVDQFKTNIPRYMRRHIAKSGITGWAQVHGLRGDTSIAERVRYDLYYIENWSLWLDVKILFLTALDVFRRIVRGVSC
ncbi:MAG TPA: undecaprenyl-phosphate glucose phosphotransferase, partial [bacterium]|nr:undecaprenyl-phosphate glucose phosphotransferase [bacterium]